jgi:hypothetical protein
LESFSQVLIFDMHFYMHSYLHKNSYSCKKWVLHNRNGSSTPVQAQQNYAQGRVNQVVMEEAQNIPTMESGTSLVNSILC